MDKAAIEKHLKDKIDGIHNLYSLVPDAIFKTEKNGKWSPHEHLQHLILAANPLILAFGLQKIVIRLYGGKANRPSKTYNDLVNTYKQKLAEGGKASAPYIPRKVKADVYKIDMVNAFDKVYEKLILKTKSWTEQNLDEYILPHPLLGKLTMREMLYFTIYHVEHHTTQVRDIYVNSKSYDEHMMQV